MIVINGQTLKVDVSNADIEGEPAANLMAVVRGALVNGTLEATEVKIKESDDED